MVTYRPVCWGKSRLRGIVGWVGGWRWVQMRSEMRRLRARIASLWVFPRVMRLW